MGQCQQLYARGNVLLRKFHMCYLDVKVKLFNTYCSLVSARFIDASIYRNTFHAIRIAIHFARIAILSANRAISCDDIHCALALTAASGLDPRAMNKLVCQC